MAGGCQLVWRGKVRDRYAQELSTTGVDKWITLTRLSLNIEKKQVAQRGRAARCWFRCGKDHQPVNKSRSSLALDAQANIFV